MLVILPGSSSHIQHNLHILAFSYIVTVLSHPNKHSTPHTVSVYENLRHISVGRLASNRSYLCTRYLPGVRGIYIGTWNSSRNEISDKVSTPGVRTFMSNTDILQQGAAESTTIPKLVGAASPLGSTKISTRSPSWASIYPALRYSTEIRCSIPPRAACGSIREQDYSHLIGG